MLISLVDENGDEKVVIEAVDILRLLGRVNLEHLMSEGLVEMMINYLKVPIQPLETLGLMTMIACDVLNGAETFTTVEPLVDPMIQVLAENVTDESIVTDCTVFFVDIMEQYAAFVSKPTLQKVMALSSKILEVHTDLDSEAAKCAHDVIFAVVDAFASTAGDELIKAGIAAAQVGLFNSQSLFHADDTISALESSIAFLNGAYSDMYIREVVDLTFIAAITQMLSNAQCNDDLRACAADLMRTLIMKVGDDEQKTEIIFGAQQTSLWSNFAGFLDSCDVEIVTSCLELIACIGPNVIARHDIEELFTTAGIFDKLPGVSTHERDYINKLVAEIQDKFSKKAKTPQVTQMM